MNSQSYLEVSVRLCYHLRFMLCLIAGMRNAAWPCRFGPAPWTGWGIYAKQLCMALVSKGVAWPHTPFGAGKLACGYEWSLLSQRINAASLKLFGALPPMKYDQDEVYDYVFHGFGNGLSEANDLPLMAT